MHCIYCGNSKASLLLSKKGSAEVLKQAPLQIDMAFATTLSEIWAFSEKEHNSPETLQ